MMLGWGTCNSHRTSPTTPIFRSSILRINDLVWQSWARLMVSEILSWVKLTQKFSETSTSSSEHFLHLVDISLQKLEKTLDVSELFSLLPKFSDRFGTFLMPL